MIKINSLIVIKHHILKLKNIKKQNKIFFSKTRLFSNKFVKQLVIKS